MHKHIFIGGMLIGFILGGTAGVVFTDRVAQQHLRAIEASFQNERADWQRADDALAGAASAQHAQLIACRQGFADAAAAQVDAVNQIQLDIDRDAATRSTGTVNPGSIYVIGQPPAPPVTQSLITSLVKFLLRR